jgi:hypothetical protein
MVLARNGAYVPRAEPPDFLSGGKVVRVDQALLRVMPDQATGANALMAGEIDYMQFLPFDLLDPLSKADGVRLMALGGPDMYQGNFRLNAASGPFADPAVRRVLWKLVDQDQILTAIGIPDRFRMKSCPAFFMCGTPYESNAGAEAARFSVADAKAELARTRYNGEPVVMLEVSGSISQIAGNLLGHGAGAARQAGGLEPVPGLFERVRHVLAADAFLRHQQLRRLPGLELRRLGDVAAEGVRTRRNAAGAQDDRRRDPGDGVRNGAVGDVGPVRDPGRLSNTGEEPDPVGVPDAVEPGDRRGVKAYPRKATARP